MPAAGTVDRGDTSSPTMGSLYIDARIVKACGNLPMPHFAFDSAAIEGGAAGTLKAMAYCFVDGPLKGKNLILVGHTDARGGPMHNLGLGQERASSVATFLRNSGVEESRMRTLSRGDLEATGTDAMGWARDRRVDVFLSD
jgi:peptidoglycan-associated lipoprotein